MGDGFWFHARSLPSAHSGIPTSSAARSSPTSVSTTTPMPPIYPTLTGTGTGIIYDISVNVSTNMSLTGIRQNQGVISSYLALGPNIRGSGPFKGTINTTKHFQFTVTDTAGNVRLSFEGVMQTATNLSGDYHSCSAIGSLLGSRCNQAPGSYGIWSVVLT